MYGKGKSNIVATAIVSSVESLLKGILINDVPSKQLEFPDRAFHHVGCQTTLPQMTSVGTQTASVERRSVGTSAVGAESVGRRSVGTQCVLPKTSVGTQLSLGSLKMAHRRSKGM